MSERLEGKVALISGTGGGLGRAAALAFAREGALVVGSGRSQENADETVRLVEAAGYTMKSLAPVDLSTPEGAQEWVASAVEAFGGIDLLYNNASAPRFVPFPVMSVEDYNYTIHNELDIVWHCTQAVWPHLVSRGGGAILNVASQAGLIGSRDLPQAAHSATKGAVLALTRQLAAEGAASHIRVNTLTPGLIASPPIAEIMSSSPNPLESMAEKTFVRRAGEPNDVVGAAIFLLSDEAGYITGSNLVVDGGMTVMV
ncbi:SDR family NAD(P)-dependent oxidoreductase [Frondihabitans cladoniiphilus]|uniref:SDR family oxidoreductase n=1 Tax=Frondihabitans cladoniiphilus TaxID=715785 RepID=A0ABP8W7H0_9MICO